MNTMYVAMVMDSNNNELCILNKYYSCEVSIESVQNDVRREYNEELHNYLLTFKKQGNVWSSQTDVEGIMYSIILV